MSVLLYSGSAFLSTACVLGVQPCLVVPCACVYLRFGDVGFCGRLNLFFLIFLSNLLHLATESMKMAKKESKGQVKKQTKDESFFLNDHNDPRDCRYRLQPSMRTNVQKLICDCRQKFFPQYKIEGPNKTTTSSIRNRKVKTEPEPKNEKEQQVDADDKFLIIQLERLEAIFDKDKDGYTYDEMRRMHKLLQHLSDQFLVIPFYEFLEVESRLTYAPPARTNEKLEANLRQLKVSQARTDFKAFTQGLTQVTNLEPLEFSKTGGTRRQTFADELRRMRGILFHAAESKLAIAGTFAGFYMAVPYLLADVPMHWRIIISFVGTSPVIVADLYNLFKMI